MPQSEIEHIGEELFFVTGSPASRRLRTQAELLSQTDVPLLITGEPGSGKSTTARLIHSLSIRSSCQFTKVNCSALTAELLESELFGYEHIGSSGRVESKPGKLEQCAKGTLYLHDFEAMPSSVQIRLLKLLQTKEFVRFGGQTPIRADVRIMAATQGDPEEALADGRLNEDLYYRLSVFEVDVPPLRDRRGEIPLLLGHFMNRLTKRYGVQAASLSNVLIEACQNYPWPGNLRQLEVFLKRFLVFGDETAALQELHHHSDLGTTDPVANGSGHESSNGPTVRSNDDKSSLKSLVRHAKGEAERNAIAQALEETHWNRKAAARLLSISYRALLYKIQEYQLIPHEGFPFRQHRNGLGNGGH